MNRVNKILNHSIYKEYLAKLSELEIDRKFCKHSIDHFLDTARLMYIYSMEACLNIDKELIYAAALLHDIGRVKEYKEKISHDEASASIAELILPECGYHELEIKEIVSAILGHRNGSESHSELGSILKKADKKSRLCFSCKEEKECKWSKEKKNWEIER